MKSEKVPFLLVCCLSFLVPAFSQTICTCYYSSDCRGRNSTCDLGGRCLPSGKKDGTCNIGTAPPLIGSADVPPVEQNNLVAADKLAVSSALDAHFRSFIKATENGGGHPDPELLQSAQNVRLSEEGHSRVERAVWVSLDAVMGWDFQYPTAVQKAEGFEGNIREVEGGTSAGAIVDADSRGLLEALRTGDTKDVAPPLQEFWAKNPNYQPNHLGRCYPHGHPEVRDMKGAVACQIEVLQRLDGMLLDTVNSATTKTEVREESKGQAGEGVSESLMK